MVYKELTDAVSKLEKEQKVLKQEAKEMVAELGDPQHQTLTAGTVQFRPCCQVWRLGTLDLTH